MATRRRAGWVLLAAVTWLSWGRYAIGQDNAASEALFNKGVSALEAGHFAEACPSLAESHRLDPRAGTLFALAECEAKWGKLASAVAHYSDYVGMVSRLPKADQTRHRDREKTASSQLEKLRPQVPQLTLVLPASAPKDTSVRRDGVTLNTVSLGTALPVDPGEHLVVTQVPGGPEHVQTITIGIRESKRVDLEVELPKASAQSSASSAFAAPSSSVPREPKPSGSTADHTWSYVTGGIGAAGVMVGTITGLMSMSKKKTVDDNCRASLCNAEGLSAADSGKTLGTISTVGFGVGIAGLAAGVVLWLTAPQPKASETGNRRWSPMVAGGGASTTVVGVQGTW